MVFKSLAVFYLIGFLTATKLKRNDLADVMWGLAFIIIAFNLTSNPIALTMVSAWGLRLSIHIGLRFLKHNNEDQRYKSFREKWGKWQALGSFFQVFLLQSVLSIIVSLPIFYYPSISDFNTLNYLGCFIFLIGFVIELIADKQLKDFIKNSKTKGGLCKIGLWNYSRHPNYFGEVLLWIGFYISSLSQNTPLITILGPLTISFLILKVSGVPMTEKFMEKRKGFKEYKKTTSKFIPWFKK